MGHLTKPALRDETRRDRTPGPRPPREGRPAIDLTAPDGVLELQQTAGNAAVSSALTGVQRDPDGGVTTNPLYESPWTDNPLYGSGSMMDDRAGSEPLPPNPVLPDKIRAVLNDKKGSKLSRLKKLAGEYDVVERNAVTGDATLMQLAKDKLGTQDYITFLTAIQMLAPGVTPSGSAHTSAEKADDVIRDKLGKYLKNAIKAGKKVQGSVAVVKGDDWTLAYEAEFGKGDPTEPSTNAFVDKKDRIIIHAERGNPGTTIHEGIHKYAPNDVLDNYGFAFNEGVTEYFCRQITDNLDPPVARTNYQSNFEVIKKLVAVVGEDVLAKAYFDGSLSKLKSAWKSAGKSTAEWKTLVKAMKEERWADAEAVL
jgi:hypothetical protein